MATKRGGALWLPVFLPLFLFLFLLIFLRQV